MADDFDMEIPAEEAEEMDLDLADDAESDPSLKVGEEEEIGKSGLKKKLVKEGEKWDTPETGDEVEGNLFNISLRPFLWCLIMYVDSDSDAPCHDVSVQCTILELC